MFEPPSFCSVASSHSSAGAEDTGKDSHGVSQEVLCVCLATSTPVTKEAGFYLSSLCSCFKNSVVLNSVVKIKIVAFTSC